VIPLAAWLATDAPAAFSLATGVTAAQALHFRLRTGTMTAFPVQVRVVYLSFLLAGALWEPLRVFNWMQLAGTTAFLTVDYCPLARMLALAPWNRERPLSLALLTETVMTPGGSWRRPRRH
jgi:hypothetical protein